MNIPIDYFPDESDVLDSASPPGLVDHIHDIAARFGHEIGGIVHIRPTALLYGAPHSRAADTLHGNRPALEQPLPACSPVFCGGCRNCGMRCWILAGEKRPLSGALFSTPCDADALRAVETRAYLIGESRTALEIVLQNEIDTLSAHHAEAFDPGEFDYLRQRWLSSDGTLALQWSLRWDPFMPIDEENAQSYLGLTRLIQVIPDSVLMPATYEGPGINPNVSDDEEDWLFDPLETGEAGVAYRDDLGRWRFRREDGLLGFFIDPDHLRVHGPWLDLEHWATEPREEDIIHPDDSPFYP